jgi:hypothetical protein
MEKMLRVFSPLYETNAYHPRLAGLGLGPRVRLGLGGLVVPLGVMQRSEPLRCD